MSVPVPLFHEVDAQINRLTRPQRLRVTAVHRLALLVTGIVAAQSWVLAQVGALLRPGLEVLVVADRAYDVPAFVARVAAYGWHWIVRCKINSALRFRDHQGHEWRLGALVARHVPGPGHRWKARGAVF